MGNLLGCNKVMNISPGEVWASVAGAPSQEGTKVHPELIRRQACLVLALFIAVFYSSATIQCVGEYQHGVPLCHHVWKSAVKQINAGLHKIKDKVRWSRTKEKAWLVFRKEVNRLFKGLSDRSKVDLFTIRSMVKAVQQKPPNRLLWHFASRLSSSF